METTFWRLVVSLGVPGLALAIFYMLFRTFRWEFAQVPVGWVGPIVVLFMLLTSGVVFYALTLWRPVRRDGKNNVAQRHGSDHDAVRLEAHGEVVTFTELLRSVQHDVVKVHAHTHMLGVAAEYEWMQRRYPESETLQQSLTTLDLIAGKGKYDKNQIHFDVIKIKLKDGREREIYFDISSFFGGGPSSSLDPNAFFARKLKELYAQQP